VKLDACLNIEHLRLQARRCLPTPIFDFLDGGADDEWSLRRNLASFDDHALSPRTLVDVSTVDTATTLLGQPLRTPLLIAPTGATALFHWSGEAAVQQASAKAGAFYVLSTMASQSLESIAKLDTTPKMLQVYVFRDRALTEGLVERAHAAGYHALCLTVDTPLGGNRERDRANGLSFPPRWGGRAMIPFALRPRWSLNALMRPRMRLANFDGTGAANSDDGVMSYVNRQFDRSLDWEDAAWLRRCWKGPFIVKGLLSVHDALRAVDVGADAVWLSNHGGRQLDGAVAPLDVVSSVRRAVGDRIGIVVDGGIRRGTHVLKALALGANACAIGRPPLFGLACAGHAGVVHALAILQGEIERGMALLGCQRIADIGPHHLASRAAQPFAMESLNVSK